MGVAGHAAPRCSPLCRTDALRAVAQQLHAKRRLSACIKFDLWAQLWLCCHSGCAPLCGLCAHQSLTDGPAAVAHQQYGCVVSFCQLVELPPRPLSRPACSCSLSSNPCDTVFFCRLWPLAFSPRTKGSTAPRRLPRHARDTATWALILATKKHLPKFE